MTEQHISHAGDSDRTAMRLIHSRLCEEIRAGRLLTAAGDDFMFLFTLASRVYGDGIDSIIESPHYDLGRAALIANARFPASQLAATLCCLLTALDCLPAAYMDRVRESWENDFVRVALAHTLRGAGAFMNPPLWDQIWGQLAQWSRDRPEDLLPDAPKSS